MNTSQTYVLASLRSTEAFLDDNAARFAGKIKLALRARLTSAITDLSAIITEQGSLARAADGNSRDRIAKRMALVRDHMFPIARVASLELSNTPAIAQLRMPKGTPSTEQLAAAAYGMAKAAIPFSDIFVAAALPDDFVAQLNTATDTMLAFSNQRVLNSNRRRGMTSGLQTKLREARAIVRAVDALVRSALKDDPALLANWQGASRVQQVRASAATATPVIAPAPAVAAA